MTPEQLKAARNALQLSQRGFADYLPCNFRTLQGWESGRFPVPEWVAHLLNAKQKPGTGLAEQGT